jgi:hypothetical protein
MTAIRTPPALGAPFADWPAIDLTGLRAVADLQTRFDTKYVVRADVLARIARVLDGRMMVLEVGGRRVVGYRTAYFDTPDLTTYRMHVQRRRRRYKIRTRTYVGQDGAMLEVKTKDKAGRTIKHRVAHPGGRPDEMPASALAFGAHSRGGLRVRPPTPIGRERDDPLLADHAARPPRRRAAHGRFRAGCADGRAGCGLRPRPRAP